jgi:predicted metal-dependent phosphoesterase TrpH
MCYTKNGEEVKMKGPENALNDPVVRFAVQHYGAQVAAIHRVSSTIDLHTHTTASDGTVEPEKLVMRAGILGIKILAITDHDTTAGLAPALAAARRYGVTVIPGIELSAYEDGRKVHILGYFIDSHNHQLQNQLEIQQVSRVERAQAMIEKLRNLGFPIAWSRVVEIARHKAIGRPHIAQALVEVGHAQSMKEAFEQLIGEHSPGYVRRQCLLSPERAIQLILDAGGLPVLAHPVSVNGTGHVGSVMLIRHLPFYIGAGLIGLEAYYNGYSQRLSFCLGAVAKVLKLVPTGGSDFHGDAKPDHVLGGVKVPDSCVKRLWDIKSAHGHPAMRPVASSAPVIGSLSSKLG